MSPDETAALSGVFIVIVAMIIIMLGGLFIIVTSGFKNANSMGVARKLGIFGFFAFLVFGVLSSPGVGTYIAYRIRTFWNNIVEMISEALAVAFQGFLFVGVAVIVVLVILRWWRK